jgi:hypothetical protein
MPSSLIHPASGFGGEGGTETSSGHSDLVDFVGDMVTRNLVQYSHDLHGGVDELYPVLSGGAPGDPMRIEMAEGVVSDRTWVYWVNPARDVSYRRYWGLADEGEGLGLRGAPGGSPLSGGLGGEGEGDDPFAAVRALDPTRDLVGYRQAQGSGDGGSGSGELTGSGEGNLLSSESGSGSGSGGSSSSGSGSGSGSGGESGSGSSSGSGGSPGGGSPGTGGSNSSDWLFLPVLTLLVGLFQDGAPAAVPGSSGSGQGTGPQRPVPKQVTMGAKDMPAKASVSKPPPAPQPMALGDAIRTRNAQIKVMAAPVDDSEAGPQSQTIRALNAAMNQHGEAFLNKQRENQKLFPQETEAVSNVNGIGVGASLVGIALAGAALSNPGTGSVAVGLAVWDLIISIDGLQSSLRGEESTVYQLARDTGGLSDGAARGVEVAAAMPNVFANFLKGMAKGFYEVATNKKSFTLYSGAGELDEVAKSALSGAAKGTADNPAEVAAAGRVASNSGATGTIRVLGSDTKGLVGGPKAGKYTFFHGTTEAGAESIASEGLKPVGWQEGDFFATTNPTRAGQFTGGKIVEIAVLEDVFLDLWGKGFIKQSPAHADAFYITPEGQKLINAALGR